MPSSMMLGNLIDFICGFKPVDLKCGANNGDWVDLHNNGQVGVLFISAAGTAGDDPTLTIKQAKDKCGSCSTCLNICTSKVFKKQAACDLTSTAQWSSAACDVACGNTVTNATSAEQVAMWAVEFDSAELNVACGYTHIQASVADVGCNAQLGYMTYYTRPKYPSNPDNVLSSIC